MARQTLKFVEEFPVSLLHEGGDIYPTLKIGRIGIEYTRSGWIYVTEVDSRSRVKRVLATFCNGRWLYNSSKGAAIVLTPVE